MGDLGRLARHIRTTRTPWVMKIRRPIGLNFRSRDEKKSRVENVGRKGREGFAMKTLFLGRD